MELVGMTGFEPAVSCPPDTHFSQTKLHPDELRNRNLGSHFVKEVPHFGSIHS